MSIPLILTTPGGGGSATPGGNTGDIQYNNAGVLGGEALVPLAHGGTNADLSASGGTTAVLAQDASHVITARNLVAADIPNHDASKITTGLLALARGGTNADLSASGSTTAVLAQDASHVITARSLVAADIPNHDASKITTGQIALAQGGTNADLSATGSTTAFLAQDASHVITARSIIAADVPNLDASKITTGVLATARGGVAQVLTAGQGGFFGILENLSFFANNIGSAGNLLANNTVFGVQFVLKAQYKVSKIVWIASNPSGTAVAPVMDVGIYNADASSLLLHSGAVSVVTTAQTTYNTSITPVTLNPGVYTLAYAGNATSGITNISYFPVQVNPDYGAFFNTNGTRWWSKASAATAGALPASISTPATRATNGSYAPLVWFEP